MVDVSASMFTPGSVSSDGGVNILVYASAGFGLDMALDKKSRVLVGFEGLYHRKGGTIILDHYATTGRFETYDYYLKYLQLNSLLYLQLSGDSRNKSYLYFGPGFDFYLSGTQNVEVKSNHLTSVKESNTAASDYATLHLSVIVGVESTLRVVKGLDVFGGIRGEYALTRINSESTLVYGVPEKYNVALGLYGGVRFALQ